SSMGQPFFARSTNARSPSTGSNRRFSTFAMSRSQVVVLAPIEFSLLSRSRLSFLEEPKSHAANTAYVSAIIAPLMRVNDDATWDRSGLFIRWPMGHREPRGRLAHHAQNRAQAKQYPDLWR